MARIDTLANFITDIATAIKAKTGKTDPITPANFDTEIASIEGGGSENLTEELNAYNSALSEQEIKIANAIELLQTKAAGGSSDEIPIPTSIDDIISGYNAYSDKIVQALFETTNINTPYINEPVTLYTPIETHKYYFIRYNNGYQLVWCNTSSIYPSTAGAGIQPAYVRIDNIDIKTDTWEYGSSSYTNVTSNTVAQYRTSDTYVTVEECIAAAQDPNTKYVKGTANTYLTHTLISDTSLTPCSNMLCFDNDRKIIPSTRISYNETIEVLPTVE